jgi:hypothetical protein
MDPWTIFALVVAFAIVVGLGPGAFLRRFSWRAKIAGWRARRR